MARSCHVCGCTDRYCEPCIRFTGEPCRWVGPRLCSACEAVRPAGRWRRGERIWVWRLLRGCHVYRVVRRLYHFVRGDHRPCDWIGFDFIIGNLRWRVPPKSGLASLRRRNLIERAGTVTGYTDWPDGYEFRLTARARALAGPAGRVAAEGGR